MNVWQGPGTHKKAVIVSVGIGELWSIWLAAPCLGLGH